MRILIIGFQRSGTTLLRRIINQHPQIRHIIHERFLLIGVTESRQLKNKITSFGYKKNEIWGEKVPFYGGIRNGVGPVPYCEKWNKFFGKRSRIIHIVRHPYDIAFSSFKKFKYIKTFDIPLIKYKKSMTNVIPKLFNMPHVLNIKYEDLLLNPNIVVPKIFRFCNVNPKVNFKKLLMQIRNPKYKKIKPERAFAYKEKQFKKKVDMKEIIDLCNQIDGPEYEV